MPQMNHSPWQGRPAVHSFLRSRGRYAARFSRELPEAALAAKTFSGFLHSPLVAFAPAASVGMTRGRVSFASPEEPLFHLRRRGHLHPRTHKSGAFLGTPAPTVHSFLRSRGRLCHMGMVGFGCV